MLKKETGQQVRIMQMDKGEVVRALTEARSAAEKRENELLVRAMQTFCIQRLPCNCMDLQSFRQAIPYAAFLLCGCVN